MPVIRIQPPIFFHFNNYIMHPNANYPPNRRKARDSIFIKKIIQFNFVWVPGKPNKKRGLHVEKWKRKLNYRMILFNYVFYIVVFHKEINCWLLLYPTTNSRTIISQHVSNQWDLLHLLTGSVYECVYYSLWSGESHAGLVTVSHYPPRRSSEFIETDLWVRRTFFK